MKGVVERTPNGEITAAVEALRVGFRYPVHLVDGEGVEEASLGLLPLELRRALRLVGEPDQARRGEPYDAEEDDYPYEFIIPTSRKDMLGCNTGADINSG